MITAVYVSGYIVIGVVTYFLANESMIRAHDTVDDLDQDIAVAASIMWPAMLLLICTLAVIRSIRFLFQNVRIVTKEETDNQSWNDHS